MKNKKEFLIFMDTCDEEIEKNNPSDAMYSELMKNSVSEYNKVYSDNIDNYDGFMFWVSKRFKKE